MPSDFRQESLARIFPHLYGYASPFGMFSESFQFFGEDSEVSYRISKFASIVKMLGQTFFISKAWIHYTKPSSSLSSDKGRKGKVWMPSGLLVTVLLRIMTMFL